MRASGFVLLVGVASLVAVVLNAASAGKKTMPKERVKILQDAEKKDEGLTLQVYHADPKSPDMAKLCQFFGISIVEVNEKTALDKLKKESCSQPPLSGDMEPGTLSMCESFNKALNMETNYVYGMSRAQCVAVTMYTSSFFRIYNDHMRKGQLDNYKVFTSILYSAIKKLDELDPVPENARLYRGMDKPFKSPESKRLFFKQFVSTSLDREVAEFFGKGTIINFVPSPKAPILAAKVKTLSVYTVEEEVLISPFEAFEFIGKNGSEMYFKSSDRQEFLLNDALECPDAPHLGASTSPASRLQLITMVKAICIFSIMLLKTL